MADTTEAHAAAGHDVAGAVAGHDAAGAAAGHAAEAVGMPQLDFSTFPNQIFWLVVALVAIYYILTKIALPRIEGILADRHAAISNDVAAAEELKAKVRDAEAAYEKALADARAESARVAGAGPFRLMFRTILPNCMAPLIVQATLSFSNAILEAAALGFLGMGAQPPTPEWGTMLAEAREFILRAWWVVTFPGLAILLTVLAVNLVGDGLRDALDPKMKRS